jgi:hypothetical protein
VDVRTELLQSQNRRSGHRFVRRCLLISAGVAVNLAVKFYGGIGVAAAEVAQPRESADEGFSRPHVTGLTGRLALGWQ